MKTPERIALLFRRAGPVIIVALAAVLIVTDSMAQYVPASQEIIQRGAYLARAADCISCHTAREGQPFAGGLPFDILVGRVFSSNITPDLETGIGRYSLEDFIRAMRKGVAKDGRRLYPAMPYPSFTKVSQENLSTLYAYFMQGVKPVRNHNRPAQLKLFLGIRSLMVVWNALYFKKGEYAIDPNKGVSWNRGAYLVQGLGHCGACHTPRGALGQEQAGSEQDGRQYLSGATVDNWYASPLTGDRGTGLRAWSQEEIAEYLKTGRTARVAAIGSMSEVVENSTQYLTDQDLIAIAEYLKSLPPSTDEGQGNADSEAQASDTSEATLALRIGDAGIRGSGVYLDNCNACHQSDGSGASRTFPNLVKCEAVNAKDPISLIHIVLDGSAMPSTQTAPSALAMPDFGWRLSDAEIAEVLSFVRSNWGNHSTEVSRNEVVRVRKALVIKKAAR